MIKRADGEAVVVGLIPAHNEGAGIAASVASLANQVDEEIVVSDNTVDDTAVQALAAGATVVESVCNTAKKARKQR